MELLNNEDAWEEVTIEDTSKSPIFTLLQNQS